MIGEDSFHHQIQSLLFPTSHKVRGTMSLWLKTDILSQSKSPLHILAIYQKL